MCSESPRNLLKEKKHRDQRGSGGVVDAGGTGEDPIDNEANYSRAPVGTPALARMNHGEFPVRPMFPRKQGFCVQPSDSVWIINRCERGRRVTPAPVRVLWSEGNRTNGPALDHLHRGPVKGVEYLFSDLSGKRNPGSQGDNTVAAWEKGASLVTTRFSPGGRERQQKRFGDGKWCRRRTGRMRAAKTQPARDRDTERPEFTGDVPEVRDLPSEEQQGLSRSKRKETG